ncbi:hypothetical protein [Oceanisphaera pacifica]|uniref:Uncharacterized protein n=1 Tax=Oceanisphaera pacifica TaxID=2818389 RepID=A0ABS3NIN8_9GAMM|nr:hypothetical protein [Oceanisphaera pacifica]MBO1520449.1 hypothetical protein [Oceanisphaera pacifica]
MSEQVFGESMKFFSDRHPDPNKRTALNVQYTLTRAGHPTVSIEIAPIYQVGAPPAWTEKITVQLTRTELTSFSCVLFELKKEVKSSYHGVAKNKSIAVYGNGPLGSAINLAESGRQLQHFLTTEDRLELAVFVVRRLSEAWKVAPSDTIALLRQAAWMEKEATR